jgi:hypothetical protein
MFDPQTMDKKAPAPRPNWFNDTRPDDTQPVPEIRYRNQFVSVPVPRPDWFQEVDHKQNELVMSIKHLPFCHWIKREIMQYAIGSMSKTVPFDPSTAKSATVLCSVHDFAALKWHPRWERPAILTGLIHAHRQEELLNPRI